MEQISGCEEVLNFIPREVYEDICEIEEFLNTDLEAEIPDELLI